MTLLPNAFATTHTDTNCLFVYFQEKSSPFTNDGRRLPNLTHIRTYHHLTTTNQTTQPTRNVHQTTDLNQTINTHTTICNAPHDLSRDHLLAL